VETPSTEADSTPSMGTDSTPSAESDSTQAGWTVVGREPKEAESSEPMRMAPTGLAPASSTTSAVKPTMDAAALNDGNFGGDGERVQAVRSEAYVRGSVGHDVDRRGADCHVAKWLRSGQLPADSRFDTDRDDAGGVDAMRWDAGRLDAVWLFAKDGDAAERCAAGRGVSKRRAAGRGGADEGLKSGRWGHGAYRRGAGRRGAGRRFNGTAWLPLFVPKEREAWRRRTRQ